MWGGGGGPGGRGFEGVSITRSCFHDVMYFIHSNIINANKFHIAFAMTLRTALLQISVTERQVESDIALNNCDNSNSQYYQFPNIDQLYEANRCYLHSCVPQLQMLFSID